MENYDNLMWAQQLHCQISLQVAAEELFNSLDERLMPKVFILGVNIDPSSKGAFVNLECEDCGYCPLHFLHINKTVESYLKIIDEWAGVDTESDILETLGNSVLAEIQRTLRKQPKNLLVETFVSSPARINGYLVFVITELNKKVMNGFYTLSQSQKSTVDGFKTSRSFIESIIQTYLDASNNALKAKSQFEFNILSKGRDELVNTAAHNFMTTISLAGRNAHNLHVLYEACNSISSLKYEGEEGLGKMIVAHRDHPNVKLAMALEEPIHITDFRKVRKFLELADHKHWLISDSVFIYGLGRLVGKYNAHNESLFVIHFTKHFHWEALHNGKILISVAFRTPSLYNEQINKERFYSTISRTFPEIARERIHALWEITLEATKQKHGTILAISSAAEQEAERLSKQSFKIKPIQLNKTLVGQLSSIDGAILLDTNSICYGIGVILDGIANHYGDSSRGARFNSALRYYEHMEKKAGIVLVVLSEDGMINLIPELKDQVNHSAILEKIKELEVLSISEPKDRSKYNRVMAFLNQHSFYFSKDECLAINGLKSKIENSYRFTDGIKMIYDNFEPNAKMNASYYFK
ncbi:diadenylate cyclase [Pedobacter sp. AW1-32]|uniref:diadenylate cyclase n=1 Tax=Pedobacter sp. AW1-32 TaxID=3383026 RepID=UPI003FF1319C